jgi:hypothetical protein
MLPGLLLGSMEVGINAAVAISSAEPRKGTVKLLLLRAPLDVWLYQMIEDVEALLLSSTASSGVVGIGVAVWWPAARVSARTTKRRRKGLLGFLRVFIRPLRSSMLVEVKNGGRDVALVVAVALSRGAETKETKTLSFSSCLSGVKGYGPVLGCGLGLGLGLLGGLVLGCGGPSGKPLFSLILFSVFFFYF